MQNKTKIIRIGAGILLSLFAFTLVLAPAVETRAEEPVKEEDSAKYGLVPCGNEKDADGKIKVPCEFDHIFVLVSRVVNFVLFVLIVPVATLCIAYAGFLLLFSGGSTEKRSRAKDLLWAVLWGMLFSFGAWVIVHTVLNILGYDGPRFGL